MADNDDFDEDEIDEENDNGPKQLRAAHRKLEKQVAALAEENATYKAKERTRSIADHLVSKSLSPKLVQLIPADVENDKASLDAWLAEYAEVFGTPVPVEGDPEVSEEDAATRQAQDRLNTATSGADTQGRSADINAKIAAADSPEALTALLQNSGA